MQPVRITDGPKEDILYITFGQSTAATGYQLSDQILLWVDPKRVSENSVLGVARLQAPCSALPSIAVSQGIRLLRAPGSGCFRSDFGLRVNFQTLSKTQNAAGLIIFNFSVHASASRKLPLPGIDDDPDSQSLLVDILTTSPVNHFLRVSKGKQIVRVTLRSPSLQEAVAA